MAPVPGTLREDLCTFLITYRRTFLKITSLDKSCRENQNTHFMFNKIFFPRKSCSFWDNVDKCDIARQATDGNIVRRMHFEYGMTETQTQNT